VCELWREIVFKPIQYALIFLLHQLSFLFHSQPGAGSKLRSSSLRTVYIMMCCPLSRLPPNILEGRGCDLWLQGNCEKINGREDLKNSKKILLHCHLVHQEANWNISRFSVVWSKLLAVISVLHEFLNYEYNRQNNWILLLTKKYYMQHSLASVEAIYPV
jgi:hypothetical protein